MSEPSSFDYAIIRAVPHVERGECLNVGVVLYCRSRGFLGARTALDRVRLEALAPGTDPEPIEDLLLAMQAICVGGKDAGPIGKLSQSERFQWLVSPKSTVVQLSEVHSGLCADPPRALAELFEKLVTPPSFSSARRG